MRPGTIAIVGGMSIVVIMAIAVLLFWFAAPRWQPELVMRYSPSLWHVIKALTYYKEPSSSRFYSLSSSGYVTYETNDKMNSIKRFELSHGDKFYAELAATDDGTDNKFSEVVMLFLRDHIGQREARAVLMQYQDKGNVHARDILNEYGKRNLFQGIPRERVLELNRR
jgi:hypothetical protein